MIKIDDDVGKKRGDILNAVFFLNSINGEDFMPK